MTMNRLKRESWVRKMQDTYSDCITTTAQSNGYFLTSQDYMDWGRDWRNKKENMDEDLLAPKPPSHATKKRQYPRKFVPYISKVGHVGIWSAEKCLDHRIDEVQPLQAQPIINGIFTRRKEIPARHPRLRPEPLPTVSLSRKARDRESIQQLIADKRIKLPDIKIHPLASREEKSRRCINQPMSGKLEMLDSSYRRPCNHFGVVRGV